MFGTHLEISTAHITQADSEELERMADDKDALLEVRCVEYGYWMLRSDLHYGLSESLVAVMKLARKHTIWWIHIDCDGSFTPDLPKYDW